MASSNQFAHQRRNTGLLDSMESFESEFEELQLGVEVVSPINTVRTPTNGTAQIGSPKRSPRRKSSLKLSRRDQRGRQTSEPLEPAESMKVLRHLDRGRAISVSVAEVDRQNTSVRTGSTVTQISPRTRQRLVLGEKNQDPRGLSEIPEDDLSRTLKRAESFKDGELPETRLENLMIEVKQSGLPKETIFATVAPPNQEQISVDQWILALKNINRGAFFPLEYEECQEIAKLLFHYPQPGYEEGFVHCRLFKDWCYNIKHLSWRAEKRRRKSSEFNLYLKHQQDDNQRSDLTLNLKEGLSRPKTAEGVPLGNQIFSGSQFFWRTRTSLQITMHLNSEFGIVSMVFINNDTGQVFPTLKVDAKTINIPSDKIQERCLKKYGPSKLKLFEQEGGMSLYENPEYQMLLAQQGKQEASARQELVAEYLMSRLTMPTPAEMEGMQGHQGPYLQKKHGDEWDTLLIETPRIDPQIKSPLKRGSSMEEFRKSLQDLHTVRSELSEHTESARDSMKQVDIVMKTLNNLSQSSPVQTRTFGESGWARQQWQWAFRLTKRQLDLEKIRTKLRTLPAYKDYMKEIDDRNAESAPTTNKSD